MRILFSCWLDIHTRNLAGSGLLDRLAKEFQKVFLALPANAAKPPIPPAVSLLPGRVVFAGRLFIWMAEAFKVHWILRNNSSEVWERQIRARYGKLIFFFRHFYWMVTPIFFLLALARLFAALPVFVACRSHVYVTSTFVWGPYDVIIGLFARLTGKPWIGLVTGWDNPSTKGRFLLEPDHIIVWGEQQVDHAVKYLGMPRSKVTALAPPQFQQLLNVRSQIPPASEPKLTYIGVGPMNYPFEERFVDSVLRWMPRTPGAENLRLAIRPHPNDPGDWYRKFDGIPGTEVDPVAFNRTSSWTVFGIDTQGLESYFRSLRASKAIIAHYSTAMLEAGLLGVPTIVPRIDYAENREFRSRFDKFVHLEEIRHSPGILVVRNEDELREALLRAAAGLPEKTLEEHFRICNHIAKIEGIEDLLGEYADLFRRFASGQFSGRFSQL